MLSRQEFQTLCAQHPLLLDGATGSNLRKMGMPRDACTEEWVLHNPLPLLTLQRQYAEAGSQVLYAPTFQAQPIALQQIGLERQTEAINAALVALSKKAAPQCLVAGNLTTMAAFLDAWDEENFDTMVAAYRRQIRGLIDGGADLLVAETLVYPQDAETILTAAELEGAGATLYSFTMQSSGDLFSGREAGPMLRELEQSGAAAVGFNCVAADQQTPALVSRLRRYVKGPLVCKPNAGNPVINQKGEAEYDLDSQGFARVLADCRQMGANILGGCCGTDPRFIAAVKDILE